MNKEQRRFSKWARGHFKVGRIVWVRKDEPKCQSKHGLPLFRYWLGWRARVELEGKK